MDSPVESAGFDWKGAPPSGHAKWITPLKNHLEEGGLADLRDRDGLIARVVGEVGVPQPRTVEAGAQLDVTLYVPASSSSSPLNSFEQAIFEHRVVFLPRSEGAHSTWPTAFHFKLVPRVVPPDSTPALLSPDSTPAGPVPLVVSGDWLTYVSGWPTQIVSICVWIYNTSVSLAITSGYYVLQASLLKWAWMYPVLLAPLGAGMVSLSLVYNEVEFMDALWFVSQLLINATFWVVRDCGRSIRRTRWSCGDGHGNDLRLSVVCGGRADPHVVVLTCLLALHYLRGDRGYD